MSKVAKVKQSSICCRNRNSRKYYYCWIKGTQHGLGYDREAADATYKALLNGNGKPAAEPEPQAAPEPAAKPAKTVAHVLRKYLEWRAKEVAAGRLAIGTLN